MRRERVVPTSALIAIGAEPRSSPAEPATVTVWVTDQGPGVEPHVAEHAFDRLWRAADAPYQGSGIGLAVVAQLAARSGGRAALANRGDGHGARASVTLPRA